MSGGSYWELETNFKTNHDLYFHGAKYCKFSDSSDIIGLFRISYILKLGNWNYDKIINFIKK